MEIKDFLNELFETKSSSSYICMWDRQTKSSRFFKNINKAAAYAEKYKNKLDVYHCCGLRNENLSPRRGTKESVIGVPGLWLEIDLKTDDKPNAPPDQQAALSLLDSLPVKYTMVVHSGNGLHVYYLFKEIWRIKAKADREKFEEINKRLLLAAQIKAREKGWEIDSVFDCTRVLRSVGTVNHKDLKNPKPVTLISNSGPRYGDPENDFDLLPELENHQQKSLVSPEAKAKISRGLVIDLAADPPAERFDDLIEIDPKFKATWQAKREDLKDKSPSGYAMALASLTAQVAWQDQEICNLIIAFYRRHGHDLKKHNLQDFITRTILKARKFINQQSVNEDLEDLNLLDGSDYDPGIDEKRAKAKSVLKEKLGLDIIKINRYVQDDPSYEMQTSSGKVFLPNIEDLIKPERLRCRVAAEIQKYFVYSKKSWPLLANALLILCEDVELQEYGSFESTMKSWLSEYITIHGASRALTSDEIREEGHFQEYPFKYAEDGYWYISLNKFFYFVYPGKGYLKGRKTLAKDLRRIGCDGVKFNVLIDGKDGCPSSKMFWRVPADFINP